MYRLLRAHLVLAPELQIKETLVPGEDYTFPTWLILIKSSAASHFYGIVVFTALHRVAILREIRKKVSIHIEGCYLENINILLQIKLKLYFL